MKLHTQTPYELRMCPIDVRVKRSKVKVRMVCLLKMVFWRTTAFLLQLQTSNFTHRFKVNPGESSNDIKWGKNLSLNLLPPRVFVLLGQSHASFFVVLRAATFHTELVKTFLVHVGCTPFKIF